LERLLTAIEHLRQELDETERVTKEGLGHRALGVPLTDERMHWEERKRARESLVAALTAMNSSVMLARAHFIRVLVDEEGFSVPDVALVLGNARQVVKRHYDAAHADIRGAAT
jgi:hypothetical protein